MAPDYNEKKPPSPKPLRLIIIFLVIVAFFLVLTLLSILDQTSEFVAVVLLFAGCILVIVSLARMITKPRAKETSELDHLNNQFSKVMRQLNAVKRTLPLINDRIYSEQTARDGIAKVIDLYADNPLDELDYLEQKNPDFFEEYRDYIENSIQFLQEDINTSEDARAMLRELRKRNETFFDYAMRERVSYLDKYK